jgi:hypothetical protein
MVATKHENDGDLEVHGPLRRFLHVEKGREGERTPI